MTPCETTNFFALDIKVFTPPSNVGANYACAYASFPPCNFMAWCLIKHTDNFAYTYAVMDSEQGYVMSSVKNG